MKKVLAIVATVVFSLAMLAGCGGSSSGSAASGPAAASGSSAASASASAASASASSASASTSIVDQEAYVSATLAKAQQLGRTKQALDLLKEASDQVFDPRLNDAYEKLYRAQWREVARTETFQPTDDEPEGRIQVSTHEWSEDGSSDLVRYDMSDLKHTSESVTYEGFEYDANGRLTRLINYEGSGTEAVFFNEYSQYDSNGNEIRFTHVRNDVGTVYDRENGYDEHNNEVFRHELVHDWLYDAAEDIIWYDNENEYDANGNLVKVTRRGQNGKVEQVSEHEYDKQGNRIKTTNYDADGNVKGTVEREYDKYAHMTKSVSRNKDGKVTSSIENAYDDNGRLVHKTYKNGEGIVTFDNVLELDENGNVVKSTEINDPDQVVTEYKYEFVPFK